MKIISVILFVLSISQNIFSSEAIVPKKKNLIQHVKALTSIKPARNYLNLKSLDRAAEYIEQNFKKYKYTVSPQIYTVQGRKYKNLIASYGPSDAPRIIIGAHYDVYGNQDGADDNASGVAGLLELARLFSLNKPKLKHRVDFVAYTLEEPPFFRTDQMGSAVHARSLKSTNTKVKLAIVLEMIGFFTEKKKSQKYPLGIMGLFYPDKGNFIAVVGRFSDSKYLKTVKKTIMKTSAIKAESLSAPASIRGIDLSDHRNYWKHGYNAIMITDTAFYRNSNYHEKTDSIETLNFDKMNECVKGLYYSILKLDK